MVSVINCQQGTVKRKPRPKATIQDLLTARKFTRFNRAELKWLLTELYHRDPATLAALDKFTPQDNYDRAIVYKADHIPATGQNLQDLIGWGDLREAVNCLSDWHDHCLRVWVSAKTEQREEWPEVITEDQMAEAIIELMRKLEVYL
jgi:hypothetical protein